MQLAVLFLPVVCFVPINFLSFIFSNTIFSATLTDTNSSWIVVGDTWEPANWLSIDPMINYIYDAMIKISYIYQGKKTFI